LHIATGSSTRQPGVEIALVQTDTGNNQREHDTIARKSNSNLRQIPHLIVRRACRDGMDTLQRTEIFQMALSASRFKKLTPGKWLRSSRLLHNAIF